VCVCVCVCMGLCVASCGQVNKTINGARFLAGFANDSRPLHVVHVYGSPYQMGLAMGQLMRQEIRSLVPQIFTWAESQIAPFVKFLPDWLQAIVEKLGVVGLLDVTFALTKPYQDAYFEQELQGLADGSGMDLKTLQQVSMFPEVCGVVC
jgi:isopenicillin-N N-acyltransferase-like protein